MLTVEFWAILRLPTSLNPCYHASEHILHGYVARTICSNETPTGATWDGAKCVSVNIPLSLSCPLTPFDICTSPLGAAAKSLQLCPTLCDPIDGSPPGSPIPGILQARTLEWVWALLQPLKSSLYVLLPNILFWCVNFYKILQKIICW